MCVWDSARIGVGVPPVETPAVERMIISMQELMHFVTWIFSAQQTVILKPKGNDGERGKTHKLRDYAATTWPDYKAHAESKGVKNISQKNYNTMLKLRVFKRLYLHA